MANELQQIAYTGANGSIGVGMPAGPIPLRCRLENSIEQRIVELQSLTPKPKAIIHLAAQVPVKRCETNPTLTRELNVEGSLRWYQAAAKMGVEHFVFISTSHVYDVASGGGQQIEIDHPLKPRSIYAKTKLEAENILRQHAAKPNRPRLTIARVFSVLSPAMREGFLLTGLHDRAQRKDFSPIPGLHNKRDFLWANEICQQLITITQRQNLPSLLHVCSGKATTIQSLAIQVFSEYHLDASVIEAAPSRPDDVASIVGRPTLL